MSCLPFLLFPALYLLGTSGAKFIHILALSSHFAALGERV